VIETPKGRIQISGNANFEDQQLFGSPQFRFATEPEIPWLNKLYDEVHFDSVKYDSATIIIAELNTQRIASGTLEHLEKNISELARIYVAPQFRKHGIAHLLVEKLMELVNEEIVYCISLPDLVNFYGSFGFQRLDSKCSSTELPTYISDKMCRCDKTYKDSCIVMLRSILK